MDTSLLCKSSYQARAKHFFSVERMLRNTPLSVSRSCVPPPHAHASLVALQATIAAKCELGTQQGEIRAPVNLTREKPFFFRKLTSCIDTCNRLRGPNTRALD